MLCKKNKLKNLSLGIDIGDDMLKAIREFVDLEEIDMPKNVSDYVFCTSIF